MEKIYVIYSKKNNQYFHKETRPRNLKLTHYPTERKQYPTLQSAKDDLNMFKDMKNYSGFQVYVEEMHEVTGKDEE